MTKNVKDVMAAIFFVGVFVGALLMSAPLAFVYHKYVEVCGTQEVIVVSDVDKHGKQIMFIGDNRYGYTWLYYTCRAGDLIKDHIHGELVAKDKEDARRKAKDILKVNYKDGRD